MKIRLLRCAPFRTDTWTHADRLPELLRTRYWKDVHPHWAQQNPDELHVIVDRLLSVDRPRAAFSAVRLDIKEIESRRIARLLRDMATEDSEPTGYYRPQSYEISQAFEVLDSRSELSRDEMAQLEFLYLGALDHNKHGIPNLERQLAESPALFAQAVGLTYKRRDNGKDPPEWRSRNEESASAIAGQTYRLLHKAKRIPGTRDDGTISVGDLIKWITDVRALCKTYGREIVGDHSIGELLSKCPAGNDGIWPCEPVRQALEVTGTQDIADGMAIGVHNARGAHWRGEGGSQERELCAKYRGWSKELAFDSPFTARLLEQIARSYEREAAWLLIGMQF